MFFLKRPDNISEIKVRLLIDIKHAKQRLYVAMAFISDEDIIESINKLNLGSEKKFILNNDTYKAKELRLFKCCKS